MNALLDNTKRWECPNCETKYTTNEALPHSPFHACRGLKGLTAPFVPAGTKSKVEAVVREDYVAGDMVQTDGDGRPVMSVITTREDGVDCSVLAPAASSAVTTRD